MIRPLRHSLIILLAITLLAGCTVAQPRRDDPWEGFNRKMFRFNQTMDKVAIRPAAQTYQKVTTAGIRRVISDFFNNVRMPITIVNDVLQGKPKAALSSTGRFVVNSTLGILGLFDPASRMGLAYDPEDFGVTLAKWGFPEGPYMVLPFFGPTTLRDVWRYPTDNYFDPMARWNRRNHDYAPTLLFLVNLRARGLSSDDLLNSAYDPYIFTRDAYRQNRLYYIYDGRPPFEVIQYLQGVEDFDPEELLNESHAPSPNQHP